MNILIFAHDCGLRGAEKVAADQAEALTRRGWKATVVVPCRTGGLADVLCGRGIDCVHVRYYHWFGTGSLRGRAYRTLSNIVAIPRMLRIVRSVQPDVILVHSIACGVGAIAARLSGTPRIWQFHETGPYGRSSDRGYFDLGERLSVRVIRWADCRLLAVSSRIADLYERKLGVAPVRVLYQAVDMNDAHPASDALALARLSSWLGPKLMIVGSLSPLKDQSTAVRAMPQILEALPDAGLFLVGDDPVGTGAEIAALARDLGIADKVVHLGTLANAAAAIARADCCIVTSLDEGFGRVTIEAILDNLSPQIHGELPHVTLPDGVTFLRSDIRDIDAQAEAVCAADATQAQTPRRKRAQELSPHPTTWAADSHVGSHAKALRHPSAR